MPLSANTVVDRFVDQTIREVPVGAAVHIYRDGFVGLDPAGYAKAFEPGDELLGIAYAEADNSSGAAAAINVKVWVQGDFEMTVTGVAVTDVGRAVYAISDDPITASQVLFTGHPDAFIGRVLTYLASNTALVRLKNVGEMPGPGDTGSYEIVEDFIRPFEATGAASATKYIGNFTAQSVLGLGVLPIAGANGGCQLDVDAVDEIASAAIWTPDNFLVSKGVTFEAKLRVSAIGDDAALDIDWGLGTLLVAASIADMSNAAMTDKAAFHLDGSVANILAWTENSGTSEDTPVDTTVDNSLTVDKEFKIIVRAAGDVEFWIDNVRYKASTTFQGMATTAVVCGFVNLEKTQNNTVGTVLIDRVRVAGGRS